MSDAYTWFEYVLLYGYKFRPVCGEKHTEQNRIFTIWWEKKVANYPIFCGLQKYNSKNSLGLNIFIPL